MSKTKELDFFCDKHNWGRGLSWYESNFPERTKVRVYGESSPNYTNFRVSPEVPERMYSLVPEAKLIYLVRDPITRMISHYVHSYTKGRENRNFETALLDALSDRPMKSYLSRSLYYQQLECFLEYYPASQILVVETEDLYAHRSSTLRSIFEFLQVHAHYSSVNSEAEYHKSANKRRKTSLGQKVSKSALGRVIERFPKGELGGLFTELFYYPLSKPVTRPTLSPELFDLFRDALVEDADNLRKFTGRQFKSWSV